MNNDSKEHEAWAVYGENIVRMELGYGYIRYDGSKETRIYDTVGNDIYGKFSNTNYSPRVKDYYLEDLKTYYN